MTLESVVIAERAARAVRRKIDRGELRREDFPLLEHMYQIIVEKHPVDIPWTAFESETVIG